MARMLQDPDSHTGCHHCFHCELQQASGIVIVGVVYRLGGTIEICCLSIYVLLHILGVPTVAYLRSAQQYHCLSVMLSFQVDNRSS